MCLHTTLIPLSPFSLRAKGVYQSRFKARFMRARGYSQTLVRTLYETTMILGRGGLSKAAFADLTVTPIYQGRPHGGMSALVGHLSEFALQSAHGSRNIAILVKLTR